MVEPVRFNHEKRQMYFRDYVGSMLYSTETKMFYGRVLGINDKLSYEGINATELAKDFQSSILEYIDFCEDKKKVPEVSKDVT